MNLFLLIFLSLAFGGESQIGTNEIPIELQVNVGAVVDRLKLTTSEGKPFRKETLQGKTSFLFFGFTSCPAVCPTVLGALSSAFKDQTLKEKAQIIFISVDPEIDTPDRIKGYVKRFGQPILGVTGSKQNISKLYQTFVKGGAGFLVDPSDHSSLIYAVGPTTQLNAVINPSIVSVPLKVRLLDISQKSQ